MSVYRVTSPTYDEPSPGWYASDADGNIMGPFWSRDAALDALTDCAYSDWLADGYDRRRDDELTRGDK